MTGDGGRALAGKIFVNYRREDTRAEAARLHDRLEHVFGAESVFMDVNNLLPGERFDIKLKEALDGTDVFLAVIGARWLDVLEARTQHGERDYVREEIAAALTAKLVVIPVLMDRAVLPKASDLPEDIRDLAFHHKHDLVHESFCRDTQALVAAIEAHCRARGVQGAAATWLARQKKSGSPHRTWQAKRPAQMPQPAWAPSWKPVAALAATTAMAVLMVQLWLGGHKLLPLPAIVTQHAAPAPVTVSVPEPVPAQGQAVRIAIDAAIADNAHGRLFMPGAGTTESFKDCPDCPEMVVIPEGSFVMGSPGDEPEREIGETQHRVTFSKPFAVGRFAVTFAEWNTCVADGGCDSHRPSDQGWGRGGLPVINVDWTNAQAYVAWLSAKTGKEYRLLSEAEREYATRAGTVTPYWWGSRISPEQANYDGNYIYPGGGAKGEYREKTLPVKSFQPNPWGLYQAHGNLWEWTEDCWHDNYYGAPSDGSAWTSGDCRRRVLRGGSWYIGPRALRSACRDFGRSWIKSRFRGFRVARTLEP